MARVEDSWAAYNSVWSSTTSSQSAETGAREEATHAVTWGLAKRQYEKDSRTGRWFRKGA